MTDMIHVCSNFHGARACIINTRPDWIAGRQGRGVPDRGRSRKMVHFRGKVHFTDEVHFREEVH